MKYNFSVPKYKITKIGLRINAKGIKAILSEELRLRP